MIEAAGASKETGMPVRPHAHFLVASGFRMSMQRYRSVGDAFPDCPGVLSDSTSVWHASRENGVEKTVFPVVFGFCGYISKLNFVNSSNNPLLLCTEGKVLKIFSL